MKMVISYDSVNRVLDALINDYKKDKNYPKMKIWQDIVHGISLAKDTIHSDIRLREGYSHAISGMSKEDLNYLKAAIVEQITRIDQEDKATVYSVEINGFEEVFKTPEAAFAEANKELTEQLGYEDYSISVKIRPVKIPVSEYDKLP